VAALDAVAASGLSSEVVLGGGVALAALHLHHPRSEDLDFFLEREVEAGDLQPLMRSLKVKGTTIEWQQVGPRQTLLLVKGGAEYGRIDFAHYPFDPVGRRGRWRGLQVESLIDMTVNKVQAVLTRFQPRDFVDLYFLLREGPERDVERLLGFVRAKFDVGADRLSLAHRLLMATELRELPPLLRPVELKTLVAFFDDQARALAGRG
jgi:predicted nucleotidyltransferase component of viral defense system